MRTKGDADYFMFIELDLETFKPTFYLLTNGQAKATFRDYAGGGNCFPADVRKMVQPDDFGSLN